MDYTDLDHKMKGHPMAKEMPDSNGPVNSTEPDRPVAAASMPGGIFDRRHFLGGAALAGLGAAGAGLGVGRLARQQPPQPSAETADPQSTADLHGMAGPQGPGNDSHKYYLNVYDFGARGNGRADDTAAIQRALDAAAKKGGIVAVPAGTYLVRSHLTIPKDVILEGVWRSLDRPPRPTGTGVDIGLAHGIPMVQGTTLLAVEGKGNPTGEPFITIEGNATLKGVTIFHPQQVSTSNNDPSVKVIAYPWAIRGKGQDVSVMDVVLVNPYQAVDLGTFPCARHMIQRVVGQPLRTGLFINDCGDVGRVENVHWWGFGPSSYDRFTAEATAFLIGQTAWQCMFNCFSTGYGVGYHFIRGPKGPAEEAGPTGSVFLTQCHAEAVFTAVRVEDCAQGSGLVFVNGQFTGGVYGPLSGAIAIPGVTGKFDTHTIEIEPTNSGPVKFTNCNVGTARDGAGAVIVQGTGHVAFNTCTFSQWGMKDQEAPAIKATGGGLTVMGCEFTHNPAFAYGKTQVEIGPNVKSTIIVGNRMKGGVRIVNRSRGSVQIGLNTDQ